MRAAKLTFVAESRTRVYFAQHITSTCNTVFCCETSWSQTWLYAQQRVSTCIATMLRDKLKKNVARIAEPLSLVLTCAISITHVPFFLCLCLCHLCYAYRTTVNQALGQSSSHLSPFVLNGMEFSCRKRAAL